MSRRLAAIMFTDIVGYSALMGEDEQAAFSLLKNNRKIQRPIIEQFNGKWLKEIGDGVLASFDAVSDAVYCAKEIQNACQQEEGLKLRIGIHLGEVVFEDNDVFGDGVNIASRLEPLAPIGGIMISESVHKNIRNKTDLASKFVREAYLKNVKEPVKLYQVMVAGSELGMTDSNKKHDALSQLKSVSKKVIIPIVAVITLLSLVYFFYTKPDGLETIPGNAVEVTDKSIAVIPFVNLSDDPDQEYFSDGMMEEILNHLFKVGDLKLTSRTSAMQYKGSNKSIREIAAELGVAHILEGSVQKSGDEVKITVQLIDTNSDTHLWSETYQRKFTDVFAIQSEVAQKVAIALDARLQPEVIQQMDQMPTDNMEAYDLYLRAMNLNITITGDFNTQKEWLQQAINLDSKFSTAYALLGSTIIFEAGFAGDKNTEDVADEGKATLEKALLLDPMDAIAHVTMGRYYLWYEKDFNKAEIEILTAQNLAPSDVGSYDSYIDLLLAAGRFDEAIPVGSKLLESSNEKDPVSWSRMALTWAFNGQKERMLECIERVNASPLNDILPITEVARSYLVLKQYEQVLDTLNRYVGDLTVPRFMGLKAIAYYKVGENEKHLEQINSLIQKSKENAGGSPSFYTAMVYASRGETEQAFQWLEKSFEDNEVELFWLKVEPEFASLYDDPRWQQMLNRIGFPEN